MILNYIELYCKILQYIKGPKINKFQTGYTIVGTYALNRYVQYVKDIDAHVLPTLDSSWQSTYYARVEAMRLREAHEKEASLGFAKVTRATVIPAG